jgi:hypothetical protein
MRRWTGSRCEPGTDRLTGPRSRLKLLTKRLLAPRKGEAKR